MRATGRIILGLSAILIILKLAGCSENVESNKQLRDSLKAARDSAEVKAKIAASRSEFTGIYNYDETGSTIRDCTYPDSVYLISDSTGKLKSLFEKIIPSKTVYGTVVARIKGELVSTEEQKFIDKYPVTLKVKEVVSVEKKNPKNTCVPYDFWGFGNEPAWQIQISRKEGIIELTNSADGKSYFFFSNEPKDEKGVIVYSSFNTIRKNSIDVRIRKEKCRDKVSGEEFEYSIEAEITGVGKFSGCAVKGK
ncbi:MAG: hypothetical protein K1X85_10100 [Ignavibacteria bacterium]|nr:hypothetical protein [Ignavibacteria bacterium]